MHAAHLVDKDVGSSSVESPAGSRSYHFLPAILPDSSCDLGLLVQQVANEHQALSIEVDVLIWAGGVLQPQQSIQSAYTLVLQHATRLLQCIQDADSTSGMTEVPACKRLQQMQHTCSNVTNVTRSSPEAGCCLTAGCMPRVWDAHPSYLLLDGLVALLLR